MRTQPNMNESADVRPPPRKRLLFGAGVFLLGQLSPLLIPVVAQSTLSTTWRTVLSGLLLLGIPELAILVAVGLLGKSGYRYLKARILGFIGRQVRSEAVGRTRHGVGLCLFLLPFLWGWAYPYLQEISPVVGEHRLWTAVSGDALLVIGLILLGEGFWEKLRNLFAYGGLPTQRSPGDKAGS